MHGVGGCDDAALETIRAEVAELEARHSWKRAAFLLLAIGFNQMLRQTKSLTGLATKQISTTELEFFSAWP